jgi:hypothetical protein
VLNQWLGQWSEEALDYTLRQLPSVKQVVWAHALGVLPQLPQLISHLYHHHGITSTLYAQAAALTQHGQALLNSGLSRLVVEVESTQPAQYQYLRNEDIYLFRQHKEALYQFLTQRLHHAAQHSQQPIKHPPLRVVASVTLTPHTLHTLPFLLKDLEQWGVDEVWGDNGHTFSQLNAPQAYNPYLLAGQSPLSETLETIDPLGFRLPYRIASPLQPLEEASEAELPRFCRLPHEVVVMDWGFNTAACPRWLVHNQQQEPHSSPKVWEGDCWHSPQYQWLRHVHHKAHHQAVNALPPPPTTANEAPMLPTPCTYCPHNSAQNAQCHNTHLLPTPLPSSSTNPLP